MLETHETTRIYDRKSGRAVKSTLHLHRVMTRPRENIQLRTRVDPTPIAIVRPIARPRGMPREYIVP